MFGKDMKQNLLIFDNPLINHKTIVMKNLFNNYKIRRAFVTLVCILSLTTMSAQSYYHYDPYKSCYYYDAPYLDEYDLANDSILSYVSQPIPSIGGPLSWVDSDRWGICLDRTNFPQMADGQSYGILIALGSQGGVNSSRWYDLGDQFEYYDGNLYYDGLGVANIVSDGPLPISGDFSEDDIENWMEWLIGWTKCHLYNDSYEWTFSSETSLAIRIYIR